MSSGRFEVARRSAELLEVVLEGALDEARIAACEADVRASLSAVRDGGVRVLVDLTGVEGYSLGAREALVALQGVIGRRSCQTAYCAAATEGRALALWVAHMSADQVIKTLRSREDALAWLGGEGPPTTGVRPLARASEHPTARAHAKLVG
ncbi:MAG: hypothetical protein PVI30_21560 [Myxococcales bacterium]|jgi:hypothetical protein